MHLDYFYKLNLLKEMKADTSFLFDIFSDKKHLDKKWVK